MSEEKKVSDAARALSKLGASKGGLGRARSLTPGRRTAIAKKAAASRWGNEQDGFLVSAEITPADVLLPDDDIIPGSSEGLPLAEYMGFLNLMEMQIPCYVLDNGQRVIGRTATTEMLTGIKGGGGLEKYLGVAPLKPFIDMEMVLERMQAFSLPEVEGLGRAVKGLTADLVIDICRGFVAALNANERPDTHPEKPLTQRQKEMATNASMFLAACAKVGLDALIDEATGYQYARAEDALQVKLRAYLEDEMRKWEKTFPDELWTQFGRLTNWRGSVTKRPKYWGKLVMELVYDYLDKDVADWLRENAPAPKKGQNYHQWLSSQYGLKKLVEHIWKLIGVASTCYSMTELKEKMAELSGRVAVQYRFYLRPSNEDSKETRIEHKREST